MTDYTGTDNLEVMQEAVRYNLFLENLVLEYAGSNNRVLDFGAGIGTFARQVHNRGLDVRCVEVDERQAELIREQGLPTETSSRDIPDHSIDFIYSLNVLEHIEDDESALLELRRCLAPGGRILIYVPALQFLYSSMDRKVGHFRRYSRSSLSQTAQRAGFKVCLCRYADSLGVPATLAYKLGNNQSGSVNKRALVLYDRIAFPVSRLLDVMLFQYIGGKNVYALLECAGDSE